LREIVQNYISQSQMKGFLNSSCIPALPAYEYRGYIISGWARPELANGVHLSRYRLRAEQARVNHSGSRIEDELFESKDQAEQPD
jgi:hypothetical protein